MIDSDTMRTKTPEPPRIVQSIVCKMADGIDHRQITRRMPWANRAHVRAYMHGQPIRLSERAIDQIIDTIEAIKSQGQA